MSAARKIIQTNRFKNRLNGFDFFALIFGLFLGLALIKFGNPIILNSKILRPNSAAELWSNAWPPLWGVALLIPLAIVGGGLAILAKRRWMTSHWLWILPLIWFGWQCVSATQTVDNQLTRLAVYQFGGCLICYFAGALVIRGERSSYFLLAGLSAGFVFCMIRAADQKLFEFPRERQMLIEGEQTGWTNFPVVVFEEMKQTGAIVSTNGADVVNPIFLAKYEKGRVHGTLVYPNALAGAVLLLFPVALTLIWKITRQLRIVTRTLALGLILFLGVGGLIWSGSKSGWLIAILMALFWIWRLDWPKRLKWGVLIVLLGTGLVGFGIRFHSYFQKGATSVVARFDYWHAAVKIVTQNPWLGSGPGTFQKPYATLKSPEAEMARLTHNDYLEQFSDSGFPGGLSYATWIVLWIWLVSRKIWQRTDWLEVSVFMGIVGWLLQGLTEFSLYIPALAWAAFALMGCLLQNDSTKTKMPDILTP